ncbi:hypothetical protein ABG067_009072, partial [Albugo candida]
MSTMSPSTQQQSNDTIMNRIEKLAKKHNKSNAQIAMAWLYAQPYVTSPIVGV